MGKASVFFSGWDGGATKTAVRLVDASGRLIAENSFGPLNLNGTSPEAVRRHVADAIAWTAQQSGGSSLCGGLVIGAAGVSNLNVRAALEADVRAAGYSGPLRILGDQEIALHGAIRTYGAVLIAGTGSVCFGRDPAGAYFRTGGRGYLIDDEGSGYAIGRDILAAAVRAADGRLPQTCLLDLVYGYLKTDTPEGIVSWVYAPATGKKEIAALSPLLLDALAREDAAALRIAEKAAAALTELVTAAWQNARMTDGELALTGSILQHYPLIREGVIQALKKDLPALRVGDPLGTPAEGAAALALRYMGT